MIFTETFLPAICKLRLARIRQTAYPQAEEFAARNVMQPPSMEEMLDLFNKAELK
jgi:hypothetical protein